MPRCEGWRRHGSAFTIGGTPRWVQCDADATVLVTMRRDGQAATQEIPACDECWAEALNTPGIVVVDAKPIHKAKGD
jgi:hypothetical protein